MFDFITSQALEGWLPRHLLDVEVTESWIAPEYRYPSRVLVDRAFAAAIGLCDTLELQCHELASLEDEGLAGRIRYLTAVAIMAAVLHDLRDCHLPDRLAYLRTVHAVAEAWRPGATYDLSNASAAQLFLHGHREAADVLGTWIWLNLVPSEAGVHFRWVASSLRFMYSYGERALAAARPLSRDIMGMLGMAGTGRDHSDETDAAVSSPGVPTECTRKAAERIAAAYIAARPGRMTGGAVAAVYSLEEIRFAKPVLYGVRLEGCWIVYLIPDATDQ